MSALETKDRVLQMLNDAVSDSDYIAVAKDVIMILRVTLPMWVELRYAYKAAEIADRINDRLRAMQIETTNASRKAKLERIALDARTIVHAANEAQWV